MVFIFTAFFAEAKPLIEYYNMHKCLQENKFQMFISEDNNISLVITGVGKIAAATVLGRILSLYGEKIDGIINIGVCGILKDNGNWDANLNSELVGKAYICNKITDYDTSRDFYPDMLIKNDFREASVITSSVMADDKFINAPENIRLSEYIRDDGNVFTGNKYVLVDMEASAIYQAANVFVGPEKMHFIKIVSDCGNVKEVTPKLVTDIVNGNINDIADYIDKCMTTFAKVICDKSIYDTYCNRLIEDIKCSKTMENELRQIFKFCKISNINALDFWDTLYREGRIPCQSKREGKVYLDEFKRKLFE